MAARHPLGNGLSFFLLCSLGFALLVTYILFTALGFIVRIPNIDTPFHLLGGAWIAWATLFFYSVKHSTPSMWTIMAIVLLAAVAWETGEWTIQTAEVGTHPFFTQATLRDVVVSMAGGGFVVLTFVLKNKLVRHAS